MDEPAMRLDLDFQDGGIVGAGKGREGLAAALAAAQLVGQVAELLGSGQMRIVASAVANGAASLATSSRGWCCGVGLLRGSGIRRCVLVGGVWGQAVGGVMGFGASSKEAVAEVANFSLELSDLLFEIVFALSGALMHGLVEVSLLSEGDGFEAVRAGWVRGVTKRRK
jgi:hypothetical protein